MYIDEEKLEAYEEKIAEEIRKKCWEDANFLIEMILAPENNFQEIFLMGAFIEKVSTYFIKQYSNHPERVASLIKVVEQWIEKNKSNRELEGTLVECYMALACMFQKKEDKDNTEKYYKEAESLANKKIEERGGFWDYADKAELYLRFKKYDDIQGILKRMKLLATDEVEEERCDRVEECCREQYYYFYEF